MTLALDRVEALTGAAATCSLVMERRIRRRGGAHGLGPATSRQAEPCFRLHLTRQRGGGSVRAQ
jgi:hypothetical protein